MASYPNPKREHIITEAVDGDIVVYDNDSQAAHYLSADAAAVWERCDGASSVADVAADLDLSRQIVELAIAELRDCGLLDAAPAGRRTYSRREAAAKLGKVGGAAFLAPLVYSVAIQPSFAFASGGGLGASASHCSASAGNKASDATDCTSGECYTLHNSSSKYCVSTTCVVYDQVCSRNTYGSCCADYSTTSTAYCTNHVTGNTYSCTD